ncbi:MAG: cell wall metabolism sensor histidine kinase WalK [Gammaproteobacteria bacterium]|nr:cell wall metabolism sensor histidine kinase WalK [Gammaproteobacteria bacterium]MDH3507292.1 cell wall metabolism sensor histidine kinase WalK [Gammaproteobacteria bacterium]
MKLSKAGNNGERSALVMVGACLLVIACIVAVVVVDQKGDHEAQIRARGISIARLLSGLPTDQLVDSETYESMLQLVSFSQGTEDFAYAALVSVSGGSLAEVSGPGVIVPSAPIANEPSGWIGERGLALGADGRRIMEYHAPVFEGGELAGQIRLGFFEPGYRLVAREVSIAAAVALLVFLLAPLFYALLRKEIKPLATAGVELEKLLQENNAAAVSPAAAPLGEFMTRFNQFVDYAQGRIRELENDRGELVASAKLISYKKTRIEAVLQTLPVGVLVLDEHGKSTYANARVGQLLGVSKGDVLTRPPREWCENSKVVEFLARYETSTAPRFANETVYFKPDENGDRTLAINGFPLLASQEPATISGTLIVISDVTQESLARQSRSEFVAHVGHELKTPLNTLALYTEVLLDDRGEDPEERIEAVNTIHDEVERMTGLVNNLLSIARIEMGSIDLDKQRVRLGDLLEDINENLGRLARRQKVSLDIDLPQQLSPILVDKDLLRVAINNLLSNAIKYNRPGGRVTVVAEETDEAMLVHIEDDGVGISEADQGHIFDKFFRSDSSEVRSRSGHGLGLSLAQQIVELHDGQISVESELGSGSKFTIALWKRFGLVKRAI